jgi:hypothetical protein
VRLTGGKMLSPGTAAATAFITSVKVFVRHISPKQLPISLEANGACSAF